MAPMPDAVELVGQRFSVTVRKADDPVLGDHEVGHCYVAGQEISVADNLAPDQMRDTLLHEVLHGILGVLPLGRSEADERVVRHLTPLLLDAFRRNPPLVAFLVAS